ncbi:MAG: shikimate kinase [Gammaproteobacteria bacterium]|nr:shikimate kinase [Gammaproteobacteria bacterium]
MGAGKTTIGRRIAQYYECEFYDSDRVIEERTGVSIPLIFELEGEEGFRKRESDVISDLITKDNIVLATGGGAVLLEKNRELMKDSAFIIFLNASLEQLYKRTSRDKNRPLLQTENPKEKLQNILDERLEIYKSIADLEIVTDNQSINHTVNNLIKSISNIKN